MKSPVWLNQVKEDEVVTLMKMCTESRARSILLKLGKNFASCFANSGKMLVLLITLVACSTKLRDIVAVVDSRSGEGKRQKKESEVSVNCAGVRLEKLKMKVRI